MHSVSTDRIDKHVVLHAPIERVWAAISNAREFGAWFGVDIQDGEFAQGARVQGKITHPGYEHVTWDVLIERLEPPRVLAWRWHPNAIEAGRDYSAEPSTLVTFALESVADGTRLHISETGFDALPADRRDVAFRGNSDGWTAQAENIERYVGEQR